MLARSRRRRAPPCTRLPRTHTSTASSICTVVPATPGAEAQRSWPCSDRPRARLRRRAGRGDVRRRWRAAGQRAGAAPAQQRPLDARRGADQPVRAAGARGVRRRPRATRRWSPRPWRWSTCSATCGPTASRTGARRLDRPGASPAPVRQGHAPRPGRKMGHITVTAARPSAERRASGASSLPADRMVCADHGCGVDHRPHRLARSTGRQLVVPARHLRHRLPRLGHPDRAERDDASSSAASRPARADYSIYRLVIAAGAIGAFLGDNTAYLIGLRPVGWFERRAERKPKFANEAGVGSATDPASAAGCC